MPSAAGRVKTRPEAVAAVSQGDGDNLKDAYSQRQVFGISMVDGFRLRC